MYSYIKTQRGKYVNELISMITIKAHNFLVEVLTTVLKSSNIITINSFNLISGTGGKKFRKKNKKVIDNLKTIV